MSHARALAGALSFTLLAGACTDAGTRGTPSPTPPAVSGTPASPSTSPGVTAISRAPCGDARAGTTVGFRTAVDGRYRRHSAAFARAIHAVLCDGRGWIASGAVRFRYDPGGRLLIGLRTPGEAQRRCLALIHQSVNRFYSCGTPREVVINADRWFGNSPYWPGPLRDYRRMLTNHEVGHALLLHHQQCLRSGARAPVMMQQSKGLTSPNGKTCRRNPWPLPEELARVRD